MKLVSNKKIQKREEELRSFLERVRARPKRELVAVPIHGGAGWRIEKIQLPFQKEK